MSEQTDLVGTEDPYGGHDRETYFKMVERRNAMLDSHRVETMGYVHKLSAWMIAQLFIANSGALALAGDEVDTNGQAAFVVGMIAAMTCGLGAWWQSHQVYHHLFDLSGPEAFSSVEHWKTNDPARSKIETWLMRAAVGSGVVSLVAFAYGAFSTIL